MRIAPLCFGAIHSPISVPQQRGAVGPIGRVGTDADTNGHEHLAAVHGKAASQLPSDCFRNPGQFGAALGVHNRDELIATQARQRVACPKRPLQARRHLLKHGVAPFMTERVVHVFEVVDVNEQHTQDRAVSLGPPQGHLQMLTHQVAIREPGQTVSQGHALCAQFTAIAFDRVEDGPREDFRGRGVFYQVVLRALLNGADGERHIVIATQHHDRHIGNGLADSRQRLQPGRVAQTEIKQHEVEHSYAQGLERTRQGGHMAEVTGTDGCGLNHHLKQPNVRQVIFDDENIQGRLPLAAAVLNRQVGCRGVSGHHSVLILLRGATPR